MPVPGPAPGQMKLRMGSCDALAKFPKFAAHAEQVPLLGLIIAWVGNPGNAFSFVFVKTTNYFASSYPHHTYIYIYSLG